MTRRVNCWDNAPMEIFFGHLKEEAVCHLKNPTFKQARQLIDNDICFYIYER
jgi:transposase InsO family protein